MNERLGVSKDSKGRWFCRIKLTDSTGKRREIKRVAKSKPEPRLILRQIVRRLENEGPRVADNLRLTFNDFADHYESNYAVPARC